MEQNQSPGKTLMLLVGAEEGFSRAPRKNAGCAAPPGSALGAAGWFG